MPLKNYYESRGELPGQIEAGVLVAADLPGVKARFLAGLPAGTLLERQARFPDQRERARVHVGAR